MLVSWHGSGGSIQRPSRQTLRRRRLDQALGRSTDAMPRALETSFVTFARPERRRAKEGTDVSQTADRCRGQRAGVVLYRERRKRRQAGRTVRRRCRRSMRSGAVVRSRSGTVRAGGPPGDLRESPTAVFSAVSAGVRMQRQYLCERLPSYQEQGDEKARRKMLKLACACNGG